MGSGFGNIGFTYRGLYKGYTGLYTQGCYGDEKGA